MKHRTKKILVVAVTACIAILSASVSAIAETQEQPTEKVLQPQGLDYAGIYELRQIDPSLTGSGVKFAVICRSITYIDGEPQNDYQPNIEHNCFSVEQFGFYDQGEVPAGVSLHSTAICSILLGEDPNAFNRQLGQFHYQGTAPQASADIYEFWHFLINNVSGNRPPDADILTASIGSPFEDWWTRGIESMAEHYGLIVVAGIGNGSNAYDPVLYPAASANVIGVGVVDSVKAEELATSLAHFSLAYPEHSSFGPTADSRCKPDIVAVGNCLAADCNEPNNYEPSGNWSSFSTPIVAGTIGLLVQKARQEPNLSSALAENGGNCVMKAILLNSARKLPYWHKGRLGKDDDHFVPLDYVQGAGMLNAVGSYKHLIAGQNEPGDCPGTGWDLNLLQQNKSPENIYKISVKKPAEEFITATLAWNKHYNSNYPFEPKPEKDGNLRLELWVVDPNNPANDYLLDYSDSNSDNLEHIYCRADANYTDYEVAVLYSGDSEPNQMAPAQRYGLAWNVGKKQNDDSVFLYDLNGDGIISDLDIALLINNFLSSLKTPESYLLGDINNDGSIDVNDFQILLSHRDVRADWYRD